MKLFSLALRNLRRNKRRTALTASAIAFGLGMMMFNIALGSGQYKAILESGISAMAGHVVVEHPAYSKDGEVDQLVGQASSRVRTLEGVAGAARITPRVNLGGLVNSTTNSVGVGLRGILPSVEGEVNDLPEKIVAGEWLADDDDRGIVLGVNLAEQLAVETGDKVVFMGQGVGDEVESRLFRVRGMFRTGAPEQDAFVAFATLAAAQEVLGAPDSVHQIAVHLDDPHRTEEVATVKLGDDVRVMTWSEALPDLVGFIAVDRSSNDFLNSVIGLIVAMGVLNTVLMSVLERTREFGVLLAIGMRPRRVGLLVLFEGLLIGVLGTVLGLVVGVMLAWPLVTYGIDMSSMMNGENISMEGAVISSHIIGAWDLPRMGQYALVSVLFTVAAAAYPAWYISRLTPVDAMNRS